MDKLEQVKKEIERRKEDNKLKAVNRGNQRYIERALEDIDILDYIRHMQEEPVSNPIDFEKELYKAFGQVKDFTLGMRIAKWFYDIGKNSQEPVSEELNEAAIDYAESVDYRGFSNAPWNFVQDVFMAGAEWQITKLMKDATEVTVHIDAGGYPYTPEIELYDYDKDVPLAKEGDKYKVVLIKEK